MKKKEVLQTAPKTEQVSTANQNADEKKEGGEQEALREKFVRSAAKQHEILAAHKELGRGLSDEKRTLLLSLLTENYVRNNAKKLGLSTKNEEEVLAPYPIEVDTGEAEKEREEREKMEAEAKRKDEEIQALKAKLETAERKHAKQEAENRKLEIAQMNWQLLARANVKPELSEERIEESKNIVKSMLVLMEHKEDIERAVKAGRVHKNMPEVMDATIKELGTIGRDIARKDNFLVGDFVREMRETGAPIRRLARKILNTYDLKTDPGFKKAYLDDVVPQALDGLGYKKQDVRLGRNVSEDLYRIKNTTRTGTVNSDTVNEIVNIGYVDKNTDKVLRKSDVIREQ